MAKRDVKQIFLTELSKHGSQRKACKVAGVSRAWVRLQKRDDEEFAQAYSDAMEDSTDLIEEKGVRMAVAGDEKLIRYLLDARRYKKSQVDLGEVIPNIVITIGGKADG